MFISYVTILLIVFDVRMRCKDENVKRYKLELIFFTQFELIIKQDNLLKYTNCIVYNCHENWYGVKPYHTNS